MQDANASAPIYYCHYRQVEYGAATTAATTKGHRLIHDECTDPRSPRAAVAELAVDRRLHRSVRLQSNDPTSLGIGWARE